MTIKTKKNNKQNNNSRKIQSFKRKIMKGGNETIEPFGAGEYGCTYKVTDSS